MDARRIDGWKLLRADRRALLRRFPPRYRSVVAEHVTFMPGPDGAPMPEADRAEVVGRADDGAGVEALVVAIAGSTARPDGSTWHVTWSLAAGRAAKESNDVIAAHGWESVEPIPIALERSWWMWP